MAEQEFLELTHKIRKKIEEHQERTGNPYSVPDGYDQFPEDIVAGMGALLLKKDTSLWIKEQILMKFAHVGTKTALAFLQEYRNDPDDKLKFVAEMAFDECEYFMD